MPEFSLFILSGGNSKRMGVDKGLIHFQGKPMVKHLVDRFKKIIPEIIIISNKKGYRNFDVPVIKDNYQNCGPLGGIEAGLSFSKSEFNLFLSCDNPFIEYSLLKYIISNPQKTEIVFSEYEKTHPFPGLYSKSIHKNLNTLIDQGLRKMTALKNHFSVSYLDCSHFNKNNFVNFNTPEEVKCWNDNNS